MAWWLVDRQKRVIEKDETWINHEMWDMTQKIMVGWWFIQTYLKGIRIVDWSNLRSLRFQLRPLAQLDWSIGRLVDWSIRIVVDDSSYDMLWLLKTCFFHNGMKWGTKRHQKAPQIFRSSRHESCPRDRPGCFFDRGLVAADRVAGAMAIPCLIGEAKLWINKRPGTLKTWDNLS